MPRSEPIPDAQRCMKTDRAGRRCRLARLPGDYTLCYFHWNKTNTRPAVTAVPPLVVATRLLPADTKLDNPTAVRALLTGVIREVIEGNISTKQAAALGYLGQTVLYSIRESEKSAALAAAAKLEHPFLHKNPDATLAELTASLQRALEVPLQNPPQPPFDFHTSETPASAQNKDANGNAAC